MDYNRVCNTGRRSYHWALQQTLGRHTQGGGDAVALQAAGRAHEERLGSAAEAGAQADLRLAEAFQQPGWLVVPPHAAHRRRTVALKHCLRHPQTHHP